MLALTSLVIPHRAMARASAADTRIRHEPPEPSRGQPGRDKSTPTKPRAAATIAAKPHPAAGDHEGSGQLVSVFMPGLFLLPVAQQPPDLPQFVSPDDDTLTEFGATSSSGSIGLIAHNYLAGAEFFDLRVADEFFLIYGDGRVEPFVVSAIERYQALQPDSPYSEFIDLRSGGRLSASELHDMIYETPGRVVFQTCIARGNEGEWGRLFVIAKPAAD